jgi:transcriptional regulator with GAF, ATPase, and Fis domain
LDLSANHIAGASIAGSRSAVVSTPRERYWRELEGLSKVTSLLGSAMPLERVERELLETIMEVIPADRGAIILLGDNIEHFSSIFGWDRAPDRPHTAEASRAAIERALRDRVGVISTDVKSDFGSEEAVASGGVNSRRTLLTVPLLVFDRLAGVICVESENSEIQLDERHAKWLQSFGRVAAVALENSRRGEWLDSENRRLREQLDLKRNLVGESLAMQKVYGFIAKVAPVATTALIQGESGTGKELVARAIHSNSPRAGSPFVALNCAAVSDTLLESEMFGYERGAFTGAVAQKKGKIEVAHGGTLFLDEIGDLAPTLQAKLLRVLQEREFERVGSTRTIKVDIRLVAATNCNLEDAMNNGRFRPDLYYRLNVISITLPPLRERREDIPLLATYLTAKHCGRLNRPLMTISREAHDCLVRYAWPGNVRELENVMERAVVVGAGDTILPEHLPENLREMDPPQANLLSCFHEEVKRSKRELILNAIKHSNGNYNQTAKMLGLQPTYLHRLIRNLNLKENIRERRKLCLLDSRPRRFGSAAR